MPYIPEKPITSKATVSIGYGADNGQAIVICKVRIPLIPAKVIEGKNLIECIDPKALPDWRAIL